MQKPIGYWLKTLDRLIDENFDRARWPPRVCSAVTGRS